MSTEAMIGVGNASSKRKSLLFKRVQEARMRQALSSLETLWKDSVVKEDFDYIFDPSRQTFAKECRVEEGYISEGRLQMRAMWAYRVLPRSRPLLTDVLTGVS